MKRLVLLLTIILSAFVLCACSSLKYVGADFKPENESVVNTPEGFNYLAYEKSSAQENIDLVIGLDDTLDASIYSVYLEIINKNNTPYTFNLNDITFTHDSGVALTVIPTYEYVQLAVNDQLAQALLERSIEGSTTVQALDSSFYYVFLKKGDLNSDTVNIKYKDLTYTFVDGKTK